MSLSDYSHLEKEINEMPEPKVLPKGSEVKLRIIGHHEGEGEYGVWHLLTFDIPSEPYVKEIRKFISDPLDAEGSSENIKQKVYNTFKYFTNAFNIDLGVPFDWDDMIGLEGWAILGVKKDDEYGEQNTVQKFISSKGKQAKDSSTKGKKANFEETDDESF